MQPAIAHQNGRQLRFDKPQISSLQRLIPFLADSSLMPGSAVEMPQQPDWTSRCSQLADRSSPAAIRHRSKSLTKRANLTALLQMQHHHCKMCRSPLHADDTHPECVSCLGKCHADAALSGTDCSHCESFSLASLHSRIAFFSESDSTPRTLPFSSCQGLVRKKQWGRGFERPVISELTSTQCPRASPSLQREHSPVLFTQHDQPPSPKDSHTRTGYEHLPPLDESMATHLCRGDESAGKRSHRNRSSSPERVRLLEPLLPRSQKRRWPATYSRSQTELRPDEKVVQDDRFKTDPLANMPRGLVHVAGSERRVHSHPGSPPITDDS